MAHFQLQMNPPHMAQWYYRIEEETTGPISDEQLYRRIGTRRLRATDLVCRDGMKDWVTVGSLGINPSLIQAAMNAKVKHRKKDQAAAGQGRGSKTKPPSRRSSDTTPPIKINTSTDRPQLTPPPVNKPLRLNASAPPLQLARPSSADSIGSSARTVRSRPVNTMIVSAVGLAVLFLIIIGVMIFNRPAKKPIDRSAASADLNSNADSESRTVDNRAGEGSGEPISKLKASETEKDNWLPESSTKFDPEQTESAAPTPVTHADANVKSPQLNPAASRNKDPEAKTADEKPAKTLPRTDVAQPPQTWANAAAVTIFQELEVERKPKFIIEGLPLEQQLHYRVGSEIRVGEATDKGWREVQQTVVFAELREADAMSRATISTAIDELKGQVFTYKLNALLEVEDFRAISFGEKTIEVEKPFNILDTQGFRVTSVIDNDGWKELAQLTFFVPKPDQQKWESQMTHDWGALGAWRGTTGYEISSKQEQIWNITYAHVMKYIPPEIGSGGLPFEIASSTFAADQANGDITFDSRVGRVVTLKENFQVHGELEASLLGQKTKIQVSEEQTFSLRIFDQNMWNQR
jgi:hypothetical protein